MGAGMMYFSLVYYMKARNCVCLGSGGGFVPRIMSQARLELWKDQTVGGQEQYEFAVSFMKIGDYETAEFALKEFIEKNKDHDMASMPIEINNLRDIDTYYVSLSRGALSSGDTQVSGLPVCVTNEACQKFIYLFCLMYVLVFVSHYKLTF